MPVVDLPFDKVEALINEIGLGGKIVRIPDSSGEDRTLLLTHCCAADKVIADLEYESAYTQAVKDGFLTIEETSEIMRSKGIFTAEDESKVKKLGEQLSAQEKLLEMTTRVPARRDAVKETIRSLREKLIEIMHKKDQGLDFCAERKAQENKYLYLTWRGTKNPYNRDLFWPTMKDFEAETDLLFRRKVLVEYIKMTAGIDIGTLRFLARHNLWRIRYVIATKTGASLFDRALQDYSPDQLALSYWSYFYQSVYEMMPSDRPPDSIIEDDPSLDAYMKSYSEEMNREANSAREKKRAEKGSNKTAWDHGETLVMRSNPLYNDIDYSDTVESIRNKQTTDLQVKSNNPRKR